MDHPISSIVSVAPLVLAQIPAVGATEVGQWLLAGAAVAVIANQGMSFFKNLTGGFARKRSAADPDFSTRELCDQRHLMVDARLESQRMEIKSDIKGIHNRIDDVLKAVSRLEGRTS